MSTAAAMVTRIADDLNRSDINAQIALAIDRAVTHYAKEPFWFTETSGQFTTSASQIAYTSADPSAFPTDIDRIRHAKVTISGSDYTLEEWPLEKLQEMNASYGTGEPLAYAWWQNKMFFYPLPSAARVVTLYYTRSYAAMSGTSTTNDFLTYAEDLIESRARWWLFTRLQGTQGVNDQTKASAAKQEESDALTRIRERNENFSAREKIEPTSF